MSLLNLVQLTNSLSDHAHSSAQLGGITFIGVGAGDPEQMTLATANAIAVADVIILDDEWFEEILDHQHLQKRDSAAVALAGEDLESLIETEIAIALTGLSVVRMVRGDTLTNTQCKDEAVACLDQGVFVELLPNLPDFVAVPAFVGALLHPNQTSQFIRFPEEEIHESDIPGTGAAFFTLTAEQVPGFVVAAVRAGRAPVENCLVTFHGATTNQSSAWMPLNRLSTFINRAVKAGSPDTFNLAIGANSEVANWYESKPLFGWRILLPRTKESDDDLIRKVARYGASVTEVPTVAVEPPRNPSQMEKAVSGIVDGRYEWIIFTSFHAVRAVHEKLRTYGLDARAYSGLRVAAVGSATIRALEDFGISPDLVPEGQQTGQSLAAGFPVFDAMLDPINRALIPRAEVATDTLSEALASLGWEVEEVTVSRTVRANPPDAGVREAIKAGKFDAVLFTSSSAVRNLVGIAGKPPSQTVVAAIGPNTAATCEEYGLKVDAVASEPEPDFLLAALVEFAQLRRQQLLAAGEPVVPPSRRKRRRTRSTD